MLPIQTKTIPPCKHARPQRELNAVKGIVLHYTGDEGAPAINIRNYFARDSDGRFASAHYAVDDNNIIQCLPDNEMAYHVGADDYKKDALNRLSSYPNNCTIGIEMCIDKEGRITEKTRQNTIDLTVYLLKKFGLTPANLWRHFDITGKDCPSPWVQNPKEWERFKNDVAVALKGSHVKQVAVAPTKVDSVTDSKEPACSIVVNGNKLVAQGFIRNNVSYLPVRALGNAAGVEVGFANGKATLGKGTLETTETIGETGYAQAREIAQVLGYLIEWDGKTRTVTLTKVAR
jgi:N-acetylmuramoyl-L-alanine amidase